MGFVRIVDLVGGVGCMKEVEGAGAFCFLVVKIFLPEDVDVSLRSRILAA